MPYLLIGAVSMAGFLGLVAYTRRNAIQIAWWQWLLTILGCIYAVFVLAVIVSFIEEGTARGALVMGTIMGLAAVIWGVLLARLIFSRRTG